MGNFSLSCIDFENLTASFVDLMVANYYQAFVDQLYADIAIIILYNWYCAIVQTNTVFDSILSSPF
jgi:hypothetical protein